MLGIRAVPWSPDGSDKAFGILVEVSMKIKAARTHSRGAEFDQWGISEGCPR